MLTLKAIFKPRMSYLKIYAFLAVVVSVASTSSLIGLDTRQTLSLTVFAAKTAATLFFWSFRLAFGFAGLAILLVAGLISIELLIEFAYLDVILFLACMMIVIGYLEEEHFFEYIVNKMLKLAKSTYRLIIIIAISSWLFAALVDEVTSILFMTSTVLRIASLYGIDPIPMIFICIFATNIGSSATVVGNPIGVMIAFQGGLSFVDFLRWATPISAASLGVMLPLCIRYYGGYLRGIENSSIKEAALYGFDEKPIGIRRPLAIFTSLIVGLVMHRQIEHLLGLEEGTMLLGAAMIMAAVVLLLNWRRAREIVEVRVDWWTLTFFITLFATVGTLKYVGLIHIIAEGFASMSHIGEFLFPLFIYLSGILSAILDNILAVAILIPIIKELEILGIVSQHYWWGMLFAGTFFGNLLPIGSTANIVALGIVERRGIGHISIRSWIKPGALVTLSTITLATLLLYFQTLF